MNDSQEKPLNGTTDRLQQVLQGNRRALAQLLTDIENERDGAENLLTRLYPHTGRAWLIGVTGAPGTGKSTLVTALAKAYRAAGVSVGILAVDPTSPFTGGAILGDRIRMRDLSGDPGIFIRSMATRGSLGGLARAARDAARAFDAAGFEIVLIETVGAGQSEVEIARLAHTTLVVEAPGLGDDVQAIKAGILEIADVLVVNKADRAGVNVTVRALKNMLELGHPSSRSTLTAHHGQLMAVAHAPNDGQMAPLWVPPIVQTVASEHKGIDEVVSAVAAHRAFLSDEATFQAVERRQIELELHQRLRERLMARLLRELSAEGFAEIVEQVQRRQLAPQEAVAALLKDDLPRDHTQ
ncbi:MAG: methylmalonyl Co-A mutase-associated GTPase MeaB [bacterium]|nr:methylmalonyl Co-A mutase-associated GTPase MeaB [bacterium]